MVLVCGGAGFIGSHTTKALREAGTPHVVLDNLSKGHVAAVHGSRLVTANIGDYEAVVSAIRDHGVTTMMHFAASIEVGESVVDPAAYWANNVLSVHALLEAARETGVQNFIFSSTAAVYGEPQGVPIPESHPKAPTNPYGHTKLAAEQMVSDYGRAYGLRSVILRYFNAAGADPDGSLGEDHQPETHLIPRILLAVLGRSPQVSIFGTNYDTPDGTCIRDYVHVRDIALGHVLALKHLESGGDSRIYNLGHGVGHSVRQVIDAASKVVGKTLQIVESPRRPGDPARLVADSRAIREELGWRPEWPDIADMVKHAFTWFASHPTGYGDRSN